MLLMLEIFDKRNLRQLAVFALFTAYCAGLVALRMIWTGKLTFGFLVWNLFLAWLPIIFSSITQVLHKQKMLALAALSLVPWLLFLPNAPYILTDLVHLRPRAGVPYWYDILLIASFAFNGLLLGFFSLAQVHDVLVQRLRPAYAWGLVVLFSIASSYGIYLGRVLRWNSWDILRHPLRIALDSLRPFVHPMAHKEAVVMTIVLTGFMLGGYLVMRASASRVDQNRD